LARRHGVLTGSRAPGSSCLPDPRKKSLEVIRRRRRIAVRRFQPLYGFKADRRFSGSETSYFHGQLVSNRSRWASFDEHCIAHVARVGQLVSPRMTPREILDYYAANQEEHRLTHSLGRLERIRTWEILERVLPAAPRRLLDVGGGTGVYALPLAAAGYDVDLVDLAPLHVARAQALSRDAPAPLRSVTLGEARRLEFADGTFAAVVMLGPMYHLVDVNDRLQALREAHRVLAPNGVLVSAYISRFASMFDGLHREMLREPAFAAIVDADLTNGQHRNTTDRFDWFTTAYFHQPEEIKPELESAGFVVSSVLAVEGPAWVIPNLDTWLNAASAREQLLPLLRRVESEPSLLGASAHLLALASKSDGAA
jgi:SAM-dependent methyltransferase